MATILSTPPVIREPDDDAYLGAARWEYTRIDGTWLRLHYHVTVALVVFTFFVELVMGAFLFRTSMVTVSAQRFFLKFLVVPSAINSLCVAADFLIMRSKRISQPGKIYAVSLLFVCICFVLYTVHVAFAATYFIFAFAITLTIVYASYPLTCITSIASVVAIVVSELFIKWDADKVSIFQNPHRLVDFLISLVVLIAFSFACIVVTRFEQRKNRAGIQKEVERQRLKEQVLLDEMTGLYNQKAFSTRLRHIEAHEPEGRYILAVVDVDKFKRINDTWGHHVGDRSLIEFAQVLKEHPGITSFRYGGDEFCLLFQDMDLPAAQAICRDIQGKVNRLRLEEAPDLHLTASFGLAESPGRMDAIRLFVHADHALYEAKRARNAIRVFSPVTAAI
ncbi:Diguanylate cyclase [uncultured Eubacteriales bacterium]|uniref:Diguanylate cyclase n=1 Tax=uncultured Eubacteriales bacterium TaxID=172733 RepID=A0A212IUR5_9FIRM|nr:Diguanylate cyclase [uncultured Eubacteriales bacterium]